MKRLALLLFGLLGQLGTYAVYDIPSSNRIDWTTAGFPGGYPNITTIYTNIDPAVKTTAQIQNALDGCPSNQVVFILPGVHQLSAALKVRTHGVVLRGSGPVQTFFVGNFSGENLLYLDGGLYFWFNSSYALGADASKGATSITLSSPPSAGDIAVGTVLKIYQGDDTNFVFGIGIEGGPGTNSFQQCLEITSVSGSTLGFAKPLNWAYKTALGAAVKVSVRNDVPGDNLLRMSGIEDLCVSNKNSTAAANIHWGSAYKTWLKNVRSCDAAQMHVDIQDVYFSDYAHNVLTNVVAPITSSRGYGFSMGTDNPPGPPATVQFCHFYDSVFELCRGQIIFGNGSQGNVIDGIYFTNIMSESSTIMKMDIDFHSAHAAFNVVENNIGTRVDVDFFHGSSSHNVIHRNALRGRENTSQNSALIGFGAATHCRYYYVLGNIFGYSGISAQMIALGGAARYEEAYPSSFTGNNNWRAIMLGYDGEGGGISNPDSLVVSSTTLLGNYSYSNGVIDTATNLPNSFFYASRPAWYPNGFVYPPIEATTQTINIIPAEYWYQLQGYWDGGTPPPPTIPLFLKVSGKPKITGKTILK